LQRGPSFEPARVSRDGLVLTVSKPQMAR